MGFDPAQLGSYSSVAEPLVPPKDVADRTPIAAIPGVENPVILEYNVAWRFLLNPENKIFFVAIDLLASAKELLNLPA